MKRILKAVWANSYINCTTETVPSVCGGCCGKCPHLGPSGCTYPPNDKPVGCHLYPFVLDKRGNIVRRAYKSRCKGNYNSGTKPLLETFYDSFVNLFGEEQTNAALASARENKDFVFETTPSFEERLMKQKLTGEWHGFKIVDSMLEVLE